VRTRGLPVITVAPFASRGSVKLNAQLLATVPGGEAGTLDSLGGQLPPGAVILAGERLATSPGALAAAARLAAASGARLAWIPRRAGERGALEVGCLPNLLPGGRPVADPVAREQLSAVWSVDELPAQTGRDTAAILDGAGRGVLDALLFGGVEPADLADPQAALAAIEATGFVVSLELRESAVTALADVVFPVAPVAEKSGAFVDWEGRIRPFEAALSSNAATDLRVLAALADELGVDLGVRTSEQAREELFGLGTWDQNRSAPDGPSSRPVPQPGPGEAVLAGWRMLLDCGRLQDGEPYLAGTARPPVARLSAATAAAIGATDNVTVSTGRGSITLPLAITEMPDQVVWLPLNSPGSTVHRDLGVTAGAVVRIEGGRP
ncbi:MAG: molybdopterin-dependent oxidoreductase, partial [Mycobacterium sp.]